MITVTFICIILADQNAPTHPSQKPWRDQWIRHVPPSDSNQPKVTYAFQVSRPSLLDMSEGSRKWPTWLAASEDSLPYKRCRMEAESFDSKALESIENLD